LRTTAEGSDVAEKLRDAGTSIAWMSEYFISQY